MPLPSFDSKDAIPDPFREAYVEREGKWVPDDSDVRGLKDSQRRLLDEKKTTDAELSRLRTVIGDRKPEDLAALLKKQEEDEEARQRQAGDFDKLLDKRVNETKTEYEKRIAELAPYKQKYEDRELDIAIRDAAAKAGVISEDMRLIIPIVKGTRIKLDEKTGKPVVLDADGDPTGLTVEKFFAEVFKAEAPKFYQAAGGSGGGAGASNSGRTGTDGAVTITADEARDVRKYRAAKAEAERLKVPFRVEG